MAERRQAVVIGASIGGLLAARVLADSYERVVLVDRDELGPGSGPRRGVPQGRHTHGLLARGREALEEMLPGLTGELLARGALLCDVQGGVRWYNDGHLARQAASGLEGLLLSRPLLEDQVRRRVAALPEVEILAGWSVSDLVATGPGDRVIGVAGSGADGVERTLTADLVVDASGRSSRSPAWLERLGYPAPPRDEVDAAIAYTTWRFRRRADDLDGDRGVVLAACPPSTRAGVMLAQEGDSWIVTLVGYAGDRPPTDPEGWMAFARSLHRPDIAEVVTRAEPLGDPVPFRYPGSVRRRYESLDRFPRGYLVFGDALCSFNPVYGQGITVAGLEALALRDGLSAAGAGADVDARRFFRAAAGLIDVPWEIVVGSDLRFDHVPGRRTAKVRFVNRYLARLHRVAAYDAAVAHAFLRVVNLLDRPTRLMAPAVAGRVLLARPGRRRAPAPPPVAAPAGASTGASTSSGPSKSSGAAPPLVRHG